MKNDSPYGASPESSGSALRSGEAGPSAAERPLRVPDPDMTQHELEVLRIMNGEDLPGWTAGAAMWTCAAWLKGRGYAEGAYRISHRGRHYLATLAALSSETPPLGAEGTDAAGEAHDGHYD